MFQVALDGSSTVQAWLKEGIVTLMLLQWKSNKSRDKIHPLVSVGDCFGHRCDIFVSCIKSAYYGLLIIVIHSLVGKCAQQSLMFIEEDSF